MVLIGALIGGICVLPIFPAFTLAACAGAVAVFAATRGHVDFSQPRLTYLGLGAGAAALVGVVALSPAVLETVLHMGNRQGLESANTVTTGKGP